MMAEMENKPVSQELGAEGGANLTPLESLIEIGREGGLVTFNDVLSFFPDVDEPGDFDRVLDSLQTAGILVVEEEVESEPTDEDLADNELTRLSSGTDLKHLNSDDIVGTYIREVSRVPLLTGKEEVNLAKRIEKGRQAREEVAEGDYEAEELGRFREIIDSGDEAFKHLVAANGRLVVSVAKKYMGRGVPIEDLIQEGNIGLIRAAKKFDYRRGHKFSTYATWWIRQAITRGIADQGRTIRVPVHMGDSINKMLKVQHQLVQKLGREPTNEEVAAELDKTKTSKAPITASKVKMMKQVARRPLSLEQPTGDVEDDSVLGDFVEDKTELPPDETAANNLLNEHLAEVMADLPPREQRVLELRYGLADGMAYTLEEVGRKMGVTRERVRQIEAQALSRMRHPMVRKRLREYLSEDTFEYFKKPSLERARASRENIFKTGSFDSYYLSLSGRKNPMVVSSLDRLGGISLSEINKTLLGFLNFERRVLKKALGIELERGFVYSVPGIMKETGLSRYAIEGIISRGLAEIMARYKG